MESREVLLDPNYNNHDNNDNHFINFSNLLAEHRLIGETKSNQPQSKQIKSNVGFWGVGKTEVPGEKSQIHVP